MKKLLTLTLIGAATIAASAQTLQDAIKLTDREQFENATGAFKHILAADPQNAEAWFYLGENYWENDRTDSAEACYRQGVSANPRFPLNTVGLGKALWASGKTTEAQNMFTDAVTKACDKANKFSKPDQARVYREVAEALVQGNTKDYAKSLEFIAKAMEMDPKDPSAYVLKGDVLFDKDPRDGTTPLENYKKAMEINALDAKPMARKAFMYYRAGNFPASIDAYTSAIGIDQTFAPAYSGRAEAYFKARDFDKATADMNKYLELNKGNVSARVRYAQFLFLVGKYDESLQEITALRAGGVNNITLKRLEGYDLCEKKDYQTALERMNEYFQTQPADKVIALDYEYMGKIYQGLASQKPAVPPTPATPEGGKVVPPPPAPPVTGPNLDSLAGEMFLKAARMDRTKDYDFIEASKAFSKAKYFDRAIAALREKITTGKPETNDYYYLGDAANKGKRWSTADSAWATYIERFPTTYVGYKFRARAQNGMDSLEVKTFAAKPYYEEVIHRMKPEEVTKTPADMEEALNFMGLFYLYNKEAKDLPKARCYFEKVKTLNAGTSLTKQVNEVMLMTKELKDVAPSTCD